MNPGRLFAVGSRFHLKLEVTTSQKSIHSRIYSSSSHYCDSHRQIHMRGALIVFEGVDRAGKTTQCQKLVDHLRSQGVRFAVVAVVVICMVAKKMYYIDIMISYS